MVLKLRKRSLFPAIVTASSPLTLEKTGAAYAFGFSVDDLRLSLDPIYLPGASFLVATGQTRTALLSDKDDVVLRSNSGGSPNNNMQDVLPGSGSVLASGIYIYKNSDASGIYAITVASGATIDGSATKYILLGPDEAVTIRSDGANYFTVSAPSRSKVAAGTTATLQVAATGDDNNPGVLSTLPKATRQAIYDEMYHRYDLNEARMVIQHTGNFTDTGVVLRGRPPGVGNSGATTPYAHAIHFIGDQVTPTNCTITSTGSCFNAINEATFHIDGFKLISSAGDCISSSYGSVLGVGAINYGTAFSNHLKASFGGGIHFDNSYTVSGGAACHMLMLNGGTIENQGGAITATMSGTPAFASSTIGIQSGGLLSATSLTFSGAATGLRFAIGPFGGNGNVGTFGTDPNTLISGNASGTYAGGDGSMNGFSNPSVTSLNVTGLSANSFVKTDSSKNLATFATANSGVLVTDGSGAPSISTTLPNGLALGTPASGVATNLTGTAAGLTAGHVTTNANLTGLVTSVGNATSLALGQITAALGADVALNNTANYFDGPSIAQGSTGTWFVTGTVTVLDTTGAARIDAKLWDGTTVIASSESATQGSAAGTSITLSGYITGPAGNLRISCKDLANTTGAIKFNMTGNSKDSTISAFRVA